MNFFNILADPKFIFVSVVSCLFVKCGHLFPQLQNVMTTVLFKNSFVVLDCWSLIHFSLHATYGVLFSDHFWMFFLLGISWEIMEDIFASSHNTILFHWGTTDYTKNSYWYAKWDDIVMNTCGFFFGILLNYWIF